VCFGVFGCGCCVGGSDVDWGWVGFAVCVAGEGVFEEFCVG